MNKGIAVGEALLLFGLLLLAWVVYTQQEEIALLAEAVGKTGTAKATSMDGMPPPLPVERPGSVGATPPVAPSGPEVPVTAPPPPPPPTPPTFEWPPGAVGSGPAS